MAIQIKAVAVGLLYTKNREKLENSFCANRKGNDDPSTEDGYRYQGRGRFNGIGKEFYPKMTTVSRHDFVKQPDDMADPHFAVLSACEKWKAINQNELA
jgi:predicted chitinase